MMRDWMKRCLVGLLLLGLVASVPMMSGCNSRAKRDRENMSKPGFNKEAADGTKLKIDYPPIGGPGGGAPKQ
jgi:hypothetical protein